MSTEILKASDCHPPSGWWTGAIADVDVVADAIIISINFDSPSHRGYLNKFAVNPKLYGNVFVGYLKQLNIAPLRDTSGLIGNKVAVLLKPAEAFNGLPRRKIAEMRPYSGGKVMS